MSLRNLPWARSFHPALAGAAFAVAVVAGCTSSDATPGGSDSEGSGSSGQNGSSSAASTSGAGSESGASGSGGSSSTGGPPANCSEDDLSDMYTRYVEPFVSGALPQSCDSCHMTGVNMSVYARDSACETMACMVNQGVVDLETPQNSQLLSMIQMGDPQSNVFDLDTEHDAMLEWIEWSAQCFGSVCGEVTDACAPGSGTQSSGVNPIGDCSEDDLTLSFFQNVMSHKGRCNICHSGSAGAVKFAACESNEDCEGQQLCWADAATGTSSCVPPGPVLSQHAWVFEGDHEKGPLVWSNAADKDEAMRTMYNIVAMAHADETEPLDSMMLVKPLLEDFQPLAVYTDENTITDVPAGVGVGMEHGGTSKFNFGCHGMPEDPPYCPLTEAVVDCRTAQSCGGDITCADGLACQDSIGGPCRGEECYCRVDGSVCDPAFGDFVDWIMYLQSCK